MKKDLFINDYWKAGMMGLLVGDALGVPVQFMSREEIKNRPSGLVKDMEGHGTYDMPEGSWSDDGSMALATLDSIYKLGKVDLDDIMKCLVSWELKGAYTPLGYAYDQGNTCTRAIYNYIGGADARHCGVTGEHANGNGALMRILPVCLHAYDKLKSQEMTLDQAVTAVHEVAALTHNHLRSCIACGFYFFMVKSILDGDSSRPLIKLLQEGIDQAMAYYKKNITNIPQMAYLGKIFDLEAFKGAKESAIISSGYVISSIEAAMWCLITTDNLKDCLLKCVNLGDDTDTIAAIAGGLAGLYYGYESIPRTWCKKVEKYLYNM